MEENRLELAVDLLQELVRRCRCSVSVTINAHRDRHMTLADYLTHRAQWGMVSDRGPHADELIARDHIVEVQAYPVTPICFVAVTHWDVYEALRIAIAEVDRLAEYRTPIDVGVLGRPGEPARGASTGARL